MKLFGSGSADSGLLELRPMGAVELFDTALEVCSRNVRALALTVVPGYLLLGTTIMLLISYAELPPGSYTSGYGFYIIFGGLVTLTLLVAQISHGAGIYYLYRAETGLPVTPAGALAKALRHGGTLVLVAAITYMLAGVFACFFILPGIAAYSLFALCAPVVMVENVTFMRAVKRGYGMLRDFFPGSFKAHLTLAFLWFVLLISLHGAVHLGLMISRSFFDMEVGLLAESLSFFGNLTYLALLNVVILLGAGCVLSALSVLLYIDVRIRTEGIDIERMISQLPEIKERPKKPEEVAP